MHRLGALAYDALDVFTDRQAVRDSNAQYTDWRNTLNVRNCGGLTNLRFATAVSEDYLNAFGQSPLRDIIQFVAPGLGISGRNDDVRISHSRYGELPGVNLVRVRSHSNKHWLFQQKWPPFGLITIVNLLGSWSIARFSESWLRWAQESIRTCFSWSVFEILWRYTICYNAVHTE